MPASFPRSGLYFGRVTHLRLTPRRHKFTYRAFYAFLDLDGLDEAQTRLFSRNRTNLLSFRDRDHLGPGEHSLREKADTLLQSAGIDPRGGRVFVLCMPRVLGFVFNPLSVYFCFASTGALVCLLYEVNNTFGQRHTYVIPVSPAEQDHADVVRQTCRKAFYVSPFMDMDLTYSFRVRRPGEQISVGILAGKDSRAVISTLFAGRLKPISDRVIVRALMTHPLVTAKVIAAIHWEALRLWLKGVGLTQRPAAPREGLSVIGADQDGGRR